MPKKIRKKFDAKPLIFEALSELRTIPEALHYIRDKYGSDKEVSGSTIYYWINKISEDKEPEYRLNKVGDKYQFVIKESEKKKFQNLLDKLDRHYSKENYLMLSIQLKSLEPSYHVSFLKNQLENIYKLHSFSSK